MTDLPYDPTRYLLPQNFDLVARPLRKRPRAETESAFSNEFPFSIQVPRNRKYARNQKQYLKFSTDVAKYKLF
jgi:hypothetical protein